MATYTDEAQKIKIMHSDPTPHNLWQLHREQVFARLREIGADAYDMKLPETYELPRILHPHEELQAVVYGRYKQKGRYGSEHQTLSIGRGMLAVTEKRIIFLDKKPLFLSCNEIPREIIAGITFTWIWPAGTVVLNTRAGDFTVRTFNKVCARNFVMAIEETCLLNKED